MNALVINKKEYPMPESLTVRQWMDIASLNSNHEDYRQRVIQIVFGIPFDLIELVPDKTIDLVVAFVIAVMQQRPEYSLEWKMIDFDKLTFGQFIDLDVYLSGGLDKHLDSVCNLLYNLKDSKDKNFEDVIGGVNNYINYRKHLYDSYKKLFNTEEISESEQDNRVSIPPAKSWFNVVVSLADNDLTKIDQILEKPVITVFNFMAYRKEQAFKQYLEAQKQRQ